MFCKYCGMALPDDALFCTSCGNPVKKEGNSKDKEFLDTSEKTDLEKELENLKVVYEKKVKQKQEKTKKTLEEFESKKEIVKGLDQEILQMLNNEEKDLLNKKEDNLSEEIQYCPSCGFFVGENIYCGRCGREIRRQQ